MHANHPYALLTFASLEIPGIGLLALGCLIGVLATGTSTIWYSISIGSVDDSAQSFIAHQKKIFRDIVVFFWYWFRMKVWLRRFRLRSRVHTIVYVIFIVAAVFTFLEILLKLIETSYGQYLMAWLSPAIPRILSTILHESKLLAHIFYESPAVLIILGFIELLVIHHHRREHKIHKWPRATLAALGQLLHPLTKVNGLLRCSYDDATRSGHKKEFWRNFSDTFIGILAKRGTSVDITIMRYDDTIDRLVIVYSSSSPERLDYSFSPQPGEAAAGKAFSLGNPIYIPSVKYVHGVEVRPREYVLHPNVYMRTEKKPFRSMICLPIKPSSMAQSPDELPRGVLNISCEKVDSLSELEFSVASLGAEILGLMDSI